MVSVRMQPCLLTVLLLNCFCCFVSSLYFRLRDAEVKCFREEIPDETLLLGNYQTQVYDQQRAESLPAPRDLRILVVAKDPDDKLVLSRTFGSEGRFKFTSRKPGGHQICLQPISSTLPLSAGGVLTVHLDIKVGEGTNNYTKIAAEHKLTELQLRIRQLTEQVDQIQKEQNYQRFREKYFQDVSHSTNMWIFWWPVVRSLYVVAIITWHTKSW
ncbi:transmembrane emp24 domain-containing protein 9-like isoform X2 [Seriola lalandi dorsalis]|uniref:transmembrane emp24 domain-containing protein 9-like isoform X1 n=1 Tax=Seriola lalandi dorsalis TaxID=1841481 RepID=UPI000C6F8CBB|nr:transmembrane emp24 domain-containing protein 9-like isoform X1 [Seriola lalandi dorsalis]XP_023272246.1 transmembrane emp24 domain-containing protein 9-like isoform X2 [Seriola lalandi dorsalis]